jgi:L-methionine (R)-S-oxide reductase
MYNHQPISRENYQLVIDQLNLFIEDSHHQLSLLANLPALLKQIYHDANWIGFYFFYHEALHLGPFQGNTACTYIPLGKGVCGQAALRGEAQLVVNVHEYPGHIACDAASLSEVVIPILIDGHLWGVLDLDAPSIGYFNQDDVTFLTMVIDRLVKYLKPIT